MKTNNLNKQIKQSVNKIHDTQNQLMQVRSRFTLQLQEDPEVIYLSVLCAFYLGYKIHDKISTVQLITLPAKML